MEFISLYFDLKFGHVTCNQQKKTEMMVCQLQAYTLFIIIAFNYLCNKASSQYHKAKNNLKNTVQVRKITKNSVIICNCLYTHTHIYNDLYFKIIFAKEHHIIVMCGIKKNKHCRIQAIKYLKDNLGYFITELIYICYIHLYVVEYQIV